MNSAILQLSLQRKQATNFTDPVAIELNNKSIIFSNVLPYTHEI